VSFVLFATCLVAVLLGLGLMDFGGVFRFWLLGKLDKAIDMFQEHVMKAGPQHNESPLEQAKDAQIANAIRKTLGIEKKEQQ